MIVAMVVGRGAVVLGQQVRAEIALEIAPDAVDMVGIVLGVVILDQERRSLNPVVVTLALLQSAHPSELQLVEPRLLYLLQPDLRQLRSLHVGILPNQRQ